MNICFVCSEYPPALTGGIGVFIKSISENLVLKGHKIFVIGLYKDQNELVKKEIINNVIVYRVKKFTNYFGWIRSRIYVYKFLRMIIKKHQIDLIEDNDWDLLTAFYHFKNMPLILRLHDPMLGEYKKLSDIGFLKRILLTNIAKNSKKVIGVSQLTIDSFVRLFNFKVNEKYIKIYNGVNPNRKILDFPKKEKTIGTFCWHFSRKKRNYSINKSLELCYKKNP